MNNDSAWLIERNSTSARALYWSGFGPDAWTFNPDGAVRFQRRVDAERVVEGFRFDASVTEHLWMSGSGTPPASAERSGERTGAQAQENKDD